MVSLRVALLAAAVVAIFTAGWTARDWRCDAAEARRDAAAERKRRELVEFELDAWQWAVALGAGAQVKIEQRDAERQERIRAIETEVRAVAGRDCRLGADGVRRLLRVSPR